MAGYSHTIGDILKKLSQSNIDIFIETGTFKGDTSKIASMYFKHVYTIELSPKLYRLALNRFSGSKNISCLQGHSPVVLESLLPSLKEVNCIFFLDAHWAGDLGTRSSQDSPLWEELILLSERLDSHNDVIIIDDVSFIGKNFQYYFEKGKSQYFPNGGLFKSDWRNVNYEMIVSLFKKKSIKEVDDRLLIGMD